MVIYGLFFIRGPWRLRQYDNIRPFEHYYHDFDDLS